MKNTILHRFAKRIRWMFLLLALFCLPVTSSYAAIPHLINYQGRLTDSSGVPLNGAYDLTFRIYDAETAGNLLWEETHSAAVIDEGLFGVLLGSATDLNIAFDAPYFLEIKVGNEVMSPRQRMTSFGYAIRAEKADILATPAQKGDVLYYDGSTWSRLAAGTAGKFLKTQGEGANPAWDTPSAWHYSEVQVFNGTSPTGWTDLNLSSVVGTSNALVILKVMSSTSDTTDVKFRRNGDANSWSQAAWGSHTGRGGANQAFTIVCATDASGIVEWCAEGAVPNVIISVIGYIK